MVNFVCVTEESRPGQEGHVYNVTANLNPLLVPNWPLEGAILAAIIKERHEPVPQTWLAGAAWREPQSLGRLEIIVCESSQLETHELAVSGSKDSDALYFGQNDKLGMLMQLLDPAVSRTGDPVAHTSVHYHEQTAETYFLLYGACSIELRHPSTGERETVDMFNWFGQASLIVPPGWQHPVVARYSVPSVMLIVTQPPNNTKSDHHYSEQSFRDVFPRVIASGIRRTRGPSAAAKEADSQ